VNSSLSWHLNKLREVGKEAYNVSYAWKMVSSKSDAAAGWRRASSCIEEYINVLDTVKPEVLLYIEV